jgi:hypothetical protein
LNSNDECPALSLTLPWRVKSSTPLLRVGKEKPQVFGALSPGSQMIETKQEYAYKCRMRLKQRAAELGGYDPAPSGQIRFAD